MDDDNSSISVNKIHRSYADSSSESAFIGSWSSSSSSSFLNTSFDSNDVDLDSNNGDGDVVEDDDDEFIAQLTRQMTDYMLDDNEVNGDGNGNGVYGCYPKHLNSNSNLQKPIFQEQSSRRSYADTVKKSITGFEPKQTFSREKPLQQPQIQMYQVENQPRASGTSRLRGKMNESVTQQMMMMKQSTSNNNNRGMRSGIHGSGPVVGSGMRAIFLNGSGTRNVTSGTGVFLPRSPTDATDHSRKKLGCSTVLVPTRVLQALEQHFNNRESLSPSKSLTQTHRNHQVKTDKSQTQESVSVSVDHQESKLPQEWIY